MYMTITTVLCIIQFGPDYDPGLQYLEVTVITDVSHTCKYIL